MTYEMADVTFTQCHPDVPVMVNLLIDTEDDGSPMVSGMAMCPRCTRERGDVRVLRLTPAACLEALLDAWNDPERKIVPAAPSDKRAER